MRRSYRWGIRTFAVVVLLSILAPSSHAQVTGYFWNAPTGGSGNWDTITQNWSSTGSAGPVNYTWTNNGNERANFGNAAGTVTVDAGGITVNGINFNITGYTIAGPGALTWAGGNVNIAGSQTGTIAAAIAGGGTTGFSKIGLGSVILSGQNTFANGLIVSAGGTLVGIAQASGSPFSNGTILLDTSVLRLDGIAANTTTTVGTFTAAGTSRTSIGTENLIIDNSAGIGGGFTTTLAAGNLARGGQGGALIVTAQNNALGSGENVTFTNGNSLLTNGILPAWIVQNSPTTGALDFVRYGANGLQTAVYTSTDITSSSATDVVAEPAGGATASGNVAAYALKTSGPINLNGSTLTLGNNSGQTGLILNSGGSVTGGNINFGTSEGMVYFQPGAGAVGSAGNTITGNALTFVMAGAGAGTINGNIVNGAQPTSVILSAPILGSTFAINGVNTYTGGTTLSINANNSGSAGTLLLGNDAAFGTGKVTTVIGTSGTSPNLFAVGGPRTFANAFDVAGGLNFLGTNGMTLTGPLTIINASGGGRTLLNGITGGGSFVLGSSGSPSTITLGNPTSNGGDDVGKDLTLTSNAGAITVLNDAIVDPVPAAGGVVTLNGGGTIFLSSSLGTYAGGTNITGGGLTVELATDGTSTAGPLGTGTVAFNNGTNPRIRPSGGNRTLANPISYVTGIVYDNNPGETFNLSLTGSMFFNSPAQSRTVSNNMASGTTLTFGSAGSPATLTLNQGGFNLEFKNNGASGQTMVFNDAIVDPPSFSTPDTASFTGTGTVYLNGLINNSGAITVSNNGTVVFNNGASTHSGTTLFTGGGTIVPINVSSNALPGGSFTAGPFGTGTVVFNNGTNQHMIPAGADRSISNTIVMSTGFAMDNLPGETFNLTFAGPIFESAAGKFISNGFSGSPPNVPLSGGVGGAFIMGDPSAPNTITLPAGGGTLNIAAINGPVVINDVIKDGGSAGVLALNPNGGQNGTITMNNANTYTGGTTLGGTSVNAGGPIQIGTNSIGSPGSLTAGPFGTGAILTNATNGSSTIIPILIPFGGNRTVGNAISMTSGFFVANSNAAPNNLDLTGPITLGGTTRTLTNNMVGGSTLTLGSSGSPSIITLTSGLRFQTQVSGGGVTSVNDQVTSSGALTVQNGAIVYLNNNTNNYSGGTSVTGGRLIANNGNIGSATGSGPVNVTGTGAVGSGGTLAGTGSISGLITISAPTGSEASQGGVIAPGNSPGTINVGAMAWDPNGRYAFEYNASNTTTGGGVNDHISGAGALDLTQLSNTGGTQFDLNLTPVGGTPTGGQTYVIATFATGVSVPGVITGSDLTPLFTFSGTFGGTPTVTLVNNGGGSQSLDLTFDAVPEPGCLMLLGAAAGLFGVRRPRRRRAA